MIFIQKMHFTVVFLFICLTLTQSTRVYDISHLNTFGKHSFPTKNHKGHEIANEFQLHEPNNIRLLESNTNEYNITSVSPLFINNNDMVTVNFSTSNPSVNDWIGAYSPANSDITTTTPVKFGYCDEIHSYLSDGVGYLTFNFTNLRSDIKFYYFTGGVLHPYAVGSSSEIVQFYNINQPVRPRIVPTGDPNIIKLLWSSATTNYPIVVWGTQSGTYVNLVNAVTTTFTQNQMCGAPANSTGWRDPGLIHTAYLSGMTALANQKIYYKFGTTEHNTLSDMSDEHVFHVPPVAGTNPPTRPTTVVLYDDMGRGSTDMTYTWNEYGRPAVQTSNSVNNLVQQGLIDGIFHGGDISYAVGYLSVWDFFLNMISSMASSVVYMSIVGNHEIDYPNTNSYFHGTDSGGECGIPTLSYLPEPVPASLQEPWWSYDIGLIHFIGFSTENDFRRGTPQYIWLQKDLSSLNRTKTPWVLFGGHRAMYINSDYTEGPGSDVNVMNLLIEHIEPLLLKYRVNIGFYGHNHAVQRHSAIHNRQVVQKSILIYDQEGHEIHYHDNPQATVHMVIGTAGASFTKNAVSPYPEWNEKVFYKWGYAIVEVYNSSYLYWKWIDSSNDEIIDRMVITQSNPNKPWITPILLDTDDLQTAEDSADHTTSHLNEETIIAIIISISSILIISVILVSFILMIKRMRHTSQQSLVHYKTTAPVSDTLVNPILNTHKMKSLSSSSPPSSPSPDYNYSTLS